MRCGVKIRPGSNVRFWPRKADIRSNKIQTQTSHRPMLTSRQHGFRGWLSKGKRDDTIVDGEPQGSKVKRKNSTQTSRHKRRSPIYRGNFLLTPPTFGRHPAGSLCAIPVSRVADRDRRSIYYRSPRIEINVRESSTGGGGTVRLQTSAGARQAG